MTHPGVNYFNLTSILLCNTSGNVAFFNLNGLWLKSDIALCSTVRLKICGTLLIKFPFPVLHAKPDNKN